MIDRGISPNIISYDIIIRRLAEEKYLELALSMLKEMEDRDLSPSAETAESIVILAANLGNARLALDLARSYETASVRPLSGETWVHCLAASAEKLYVRVPQLRYCNVD